MMKIVCLLALATVASAGPPIGYASGYSGYGGYSGGIVNGGYSGGIVSGGVAVEQLAHQPINVAPAIRTESYDPHPQYNYGYSVSDAHTGDHHSAQESRDGDLVQGQYSLVEPGGTVRTVTYTADGVNGFNAIVNRQAPEVHHPVAVESPVVAAVPVPVRGGTYGGVSYGTQAVSYGGGYGTNLGGLSYGSGHGGATYGGYHH